jgi:hypothetical protein
MPENKRMEKINQLLPAPCKNWSAVIDTQSKCSSKPSRMVENERATLTGTLPWTRGGIA